MGPSVILDKSALEALSLAESVWLEAHLDANVVPVCQGSADFPRSAHENSPPRDRLRAQIG